MCVCVCVRVSLFVNRSVWTESDPRSILKRNLTGMNPKFSFSTGYNNQVKDPSQP